MKRILLLTSITIGLLTSCTSSTTEKTSNVLAEKSPKNIIMIVGDGMGPAYTTAYRYYKDDLSTPLVDLTIFDELLVGMASTYPVQSQGYVTDSAAAATSLATGHKTYNGAISVNTEKEDLLTIMEQAKQLGKKTGLAVTSQINHATPAAYFSHNESRRNYNEIADSYFDKRIDGQFKADVMLGGGTNYFIRDDRNLVEEFKQEGYQYIDKFSDLNTLNFQQPVLGLFADIGLPWALDSQQPDRLLTLSKAAIEHLENDNGYVLLIEASQIDWAGHSNDIAAAMGEMEDLAITLEWLKGYVDTKEDTLLVVTADHSTGGLSIAADGDYRWSPDILKTIPSSPHAIAKQLLNHKSKENKLDGALLSKLFGFDLTQEEQKSLVSLTDDKALYLQIKSIMSKRTNSGWTTGGHTGVDVQVFARGVGSQAFNGHQTNTDIAKKIFSFLSK